MESERIKISEDYISNRAWLRAAAGGKQLILCNTSALEYLQLFVGYVNEKDIEVYAKEKGEASNIQYYVVDSFDDIEYTVNGNVLCCTVSQAVNDMLKDFEHTDEQALLEALSKYYYYHGKTFEDLEILEENRRTFDQIKQWAIDYYRVDA